MRRPNVFTYIYWHQGLRAADRQQLLFAITTSRLAGTKKIRGCDLGMSQNGPHFL